MGISCYSLKSTRQNSFRCDAACDAYLGANRRTDQRADLRTDFWVDRRFRSWLTKSDYFSGDHKLEWNRFWKKTIPGLIVGLIVGLSVGVIFGLFGRLVTGLVGGFTDRVKVDKASPNQGIKLSLRNSLAAVLVSWLTVGLTVGIFGLLLRVAVGLNSTMNYEIGFFLLIFGLIVALIFGLIVGLNRGGSTVIKHYALRLILWLNGYTPFKFIKFLDQCARLILLKKVGGGYIFIHRMLLDYFAEMTPSKTEKNI